MFGGGTGYTRGPASGTLRRQASPSTLSAGKRRRQFSANPPTAWPFVATATLKATAITRSATRRPLWPRLLQCCAHRHGTVCTAIDAFLSKPKEVLANLGGATPKSRLNALLTSPNPSLHGIDSGGIAWARRFIAERPAVVNALRAHPLCAGHLSESHITLCQHMEDECLLTAIAALQEASWEVGITINDSMYVAREPRPVVEAVELAQQTIATAHGLDVQFRVVFNNVLKVYVG